MANYKQAHIVSYHLLAHAGFVMASEKGLKPGGFGKYLGVTPSTASLYFIGQVDLRTSRIYALCDWLRCTPIELHTVANELRADLRAALKVPIGVLADFHADAPHEGVRILRAWELNVCWAGKMSPGIESGHFRRDSSLMSEDDLWRLRQEAKLSREQLAKKMGVVGGTIRHWERTKFSGAHWGELALKATKG